MGAPGPQKIHRYGVAFKLTAIQMRSELGVLIKDVVAAVSEVAIGASVNGKVEIERPRR